MELEHPLYGHEVLNRFRIWVLGLSWEASLSSRAVSAASEESRKWVMD
jgi:hypothetical protein